MQPLWLAFSLRLRRWVRRSQSLKPRRQCLMAAAWETWTTKRQFGLRFQKAVFVTAFFLSTYQSTQSAAGDPVTSIYSVLVACFASLLSRINRPGEPIGSTRGVAFDRLQLSVVFEAP